MVEKVKGHGGNATVKEDGLAGGAWKAASSEAAGGVDFQRNVLLTRLLISFHTDGRIPFSNFL